MIARKIPLFALADRRHAALLHPLHKESADAQELRFDVSFGALICYCNVNFASNYESCTTTCPPLTTAALSNPVPTTSASVSASSVIDCGVGTTDISPTFELVGCPIGPGTPTVPSTRTGKTAAALEGVQQLPVYDAAHARSNRMVASSLQVSLDQ